MKLPITYMSLYKHGVGFFQRRAKLNSESVVLIFKKEEMDDILKSLTVIDHGNGKVLGVDFDTPQTKSKKLENCSIILPEHAGIWELLKILRGRKIQVKLKNDNLIVGRLVGLDEDDKRPLKKSTISILVDSEPIVRIFSISQIESVQLQDDSSYSDLDFFLETSTFRETHCMVTVRLSPGEHDLEVSYIAPAPLWQVSYRFVSGDKSENKKGLIQGWGIFHNSLEEDLEGITLSFVAGMPISFVYELYNSFTPIRPRVKEENRLVEAPISFQDMPEAKPYQEYSEDDCDVEEAMADALDDPMSPPAYQKKAERPRLEASSLQSSTEVKTVTVDRGELFEYSVDNPVYVNRGKSAMVPILNGFPEYKKELIFNEKKYKENPIAVIRFQNTTGLTLEKGPITIIDDGQYAGEGILEYTPISGEAILSYAVELGVRITPVSNYTQKVDSIRVDKGYWTEYYYVVHTTEYLIENKNSKDKVVLIEHPVTNGYELFDTIKEEESNSEFYRFKAEVPAKTKKKLVIQQRILLNRSEYLSTLSFEKVKNYFNDKFLGSNVFEEFKKMFDIINEINTLNKTISSLEKDTNRLSKKQEEIRKNIGVLSKTKDESYKTLADELLKNSEQYDKIDKEITSIKERVLEKGKALDAFILSIRS